jgi:hypothetical protein
VSGWLPPFVPLWRVILLALAWVVVIGVVIAAVTIARCVWDLK